MSNHADDRAVDALTLRDHFAAGVAAALLVQPGADRDLSSVASRSYDVADALLDEREARADAEAVAPRR
jgi:hypothetical protein